MPAFWWHYNKPASRTRKRNVWTIHYEGKCLLVYDVVCDGAKMHTRTRKSQPRGVVAGKGLVTVKRGVATITPDKPKARTKPKAKSVRPSVRKRAS